MEEVNERQHIPWEKRNEMGLARALLLTIKEVLFHPGKFFDKLAGKDSISDAFTFYIAMHILSFVLGVVVILVTEFSSIKYIVSASPSLIPVIIFVPLFICAGIFVSTAIMHLFVLVFQGKGGFAGTFNVMAYGFTAELWCSIIAIITGAIIRLCLLVFKFLPTAVTLKGSLILLFILPFFLIVGLLWMVIIAIIGYKQIHKLKTIKAMAAFLIPIVLLISIQLVIIKKQSDNEPKTLEESLKRLEQSKVRLNETKAQINCKSISTACQSYLSENGRFPSTLKELILPEPPYISGQYFVSKELAEAIESSSITGGYQYAYKFVDEKQFDLFAKPIEPNITGEKIFFIDQSNVLRIDGPSGLPVKELEAEDKLEEEIKNLQSGSETDRYWAVRRLGEFKKEAAIEPLISLLIDRDVGVRMEVAEALGKIGSQRAVEGLVKALDDNDSKVRRLAATNLGNLKDSQAVEPLLKAFKDEDKGVKKAAAEAIAKIGDSKAVEPLIELLKNEDKEVRECAATALRMPDTRVIQPLIGVLKDKEYLVKMSARESLEIIGKPALNDLINSLDDENRDEIQMILKKMKQPAVELLIKNFMEKNKERTLRANIAIVLGQLEDKSAVEVLIEALGDDDEIIRLNAVRALGKLKDDRAIDPLRKLLKEEKNSLVRNTINQAIVNIQ